MDGVLFPLDGYKARPKVRKGLIPKEPISPQIPTNGPQPKHFDPYPTYPQQRFMLELPYNPYSQEDTEKG